MPMRPLPGPPLPPSLLSPLAFLWLTYAPYTITNIIPITLALLACTHRGVSFHRIAEARVPKCLNDIDIVCEWQVLWQVPAVGSGDFECVLQVSAHKKGFLRGAAPRALLHRGPAGQGIIEGEWRRI